MEYIKSMDGVKRWPKDFYSLFLWNSPGIVESYSKFLPFSSGLPQAFSPSKTLHCMPAIRQKSPNFEPIGRGAEPPPKKRLNRASR